jgi:hypothetical protein
MSKRVNIPMLSTSHRASLPTGQMHRVRYWSLYQVCALALMVYALLNVYPLPSVVHAEEIAPQSTQDTATTTPQPEPAQLPPYTMENIPGGGAVIGDFVVGPGKVDITVKPGESKIVEMTVTNRTGERRRFNVTVEDAKGSSDPATSIVLLGDDTGPYSMKDFVSVPHVSFELDHNMRARIPVTISLPSNADPGGRYGSVLVDTVAIDAEAGVTNETVPQSAIIARIGTLFFVTIPGPTVKEGQLKDFGTVSDKTFYQQSPINFGILFENTGAIHLAPYGEMRIKNMFDEEVGFLQLDPWFVLPQSVRLREVSWDRAFLFGRYTATVNVNRSYDDTIDTLSYSFWVLPWKPLVGGFVLLFAFFFIIRTFFKKFEFKRK